MFLKRISYYCLLARRYLPNWTTYGKLDSNFKKNAQKLFLNKGLTSKLHFREKPELNYLPALCSAIESCPYKGVPGIAFHPIGLRLSLSNQSHGAISPSASSPTNQSGSILTHPLAFQTNRTLRMQCSHLHEDSPIWDQEWELLSM